MYCGAFDCASITKTAYKATIYCQKLLRISPNPFSTFPTLFILYSSELNFRCPKALEHR